LTLESLANKFLPYVPEKFIPVGMKLLCIYYNVTDKKIMRKNGFVFLHRESFKRVSSFQFQSAYHTKEYIEREFSKYFEVIEHRPRGMGGRLDMVILQKN